MIGGIEFADQTPHKLTIANRVAKLRRKGKKCMLGLTLEELRE